MEAAARQVVSPEDSSEEAKQAMRQFPVAAEATDYAEFLAFLTNNEAVDKVMTAKTLNIRLQEQPNALCAKEAHVIDLDKKMTAFEKSLSEFVPNYFNDMAKLLDRDAVNFTERYMQPNLFKSVWKLMAVFKAC